MIEVEIELRETTVYVTVGIEQHYADVESMENDCRKSRNAQDNLWHRTFLHWVALGKPQPFRCRAVFDEASPTPYQFTML